MMRPSRRGLLALTLAGSLPALTACALTSPASTQTNYQPGNGVSAQVGDVEARDLVVVGTEGGDALVTGALVNNGSKDATVTIETKGQPQPVRVVVSPGALITLGNGENETYVVVGNLSAPAGGLLDVTLSTPSGGQVVTGVPVLPPILEYTTVTPTAN